MASDESAVLFDQPGPKTRKTIRIVNWIAGIVFAIVVVLILMGGLRQSAGWREPAELGVVEAGA